MNTTKPWSSIATVVLLLMLSFKSIVGYAQEIVSVVDINTVSQGVSSTLPFDRPVILKYSTKEAYQIEYIGLVSAKKKDLPRYYAALSEDAGQFNAHATGDFPNRELNVSQTILTTGDNRFQLNIGLPILKPNTFYDIVLLRWPTAKEADMYVDLFQQYYTDGETITATFRRKLSDVNEIKKPFQHIIDTGPQAGELDIQPLITFYTSDLRAHYVTLAGLAGDAATRKKEEIRSIIQINKPRHPDGSFLLIFGQSLRLSTVSLSFDTRSKFSITPDFGYVVYGFQKDFQGLAPYLGAQIEFRYFDKDIPFKLIPNKTVLHYLSFTTGLTLVSLKKDNRREDFFSGKSMMAGLGFRLSNSVRFTFGGIGFYKEGINPLIDNTKFAMTPFLGLSIDLKLKSLIGDLTTLVPLNRK